MVTDAGEAERAKFAVVELPKKSPIEGAVEAAPGKLVSPNAIIAVRSTLWC